MAALSLDHIPNVEIGILSEIEAVEDKATDSTTPLPKSYLNFITKIATKLGLNF